MTATLSYPRDFKLFASARTVSMLGNGFARVALAFAVLSLPHAGPAQLSIALICQSVPQIALMLAGGVLADRLPRVRLMIYSDLCAAGTWVGLYLVVAAHSQAYLAVYGLAAISGIASAVMLPAMSGMVSELVDPGLRQRANGMLRIGENLAALVGMAGAGLSAALFGPALALIVNAGSFALSAGLAMLMSAAPSRAVTTSILGDLRAGAREFVSRQWVWVIVLQSAFVTAVFTAEIGVLGPLAAKSHLGGVGGWSWVLAAQALGTVVGAASIARVHVPRPMLLATLVSFFIAGPMVALAFVPHIAVVAAAAFVSGAAMDVFAVLWFTALQQEVTESMISRISSFDYLGLLVFAPVGLALTGPAINTLGLNESLGICAIVVVVTSALALCSPQVRGLRHLPSRADTAPDELATVPV